MVISIRTILPAAVAIALAGCEAREVRDPGAGLPPPREAAPTIDAKSVQAAIQGGLYQRSPAFERVSTIFPSTKDPVNVAIWVSTPGARDYRLIDPDAPASAGPGIVLPEGTIVVDAVYDPANFADFAATRALMLLVKGPPGYDVSFGDWAYGVTDPDGNVLPASFLEAEGAGSPPDPTPLFGAGAAADCAQGCHENQRGPKDDFLFGVATSWQVPGP